MGNGQPDPRRPDPISFVGSRNMTPSARPNFSQHDPFGSASRSGRKRFKGVMLRIFGCGRADIEGFLKAYADYLPKDSQHDPFASAFGSAIHRPNFSQHDPFGRPWHQAHHLSRPDPFGLHLSALNFSGRLTGRSPWSCERASRHPPPARLHWWQACWRCTQAAGERKRYGDLCLQ